MRGGGGKIALYVEGCAGEALTSPLSGGRRLPLLAWRLQGDRPPGRFPSRRSLAQAPRLVTVIPGTGAPAASFGAALAPPRTCCAPPPPPLARAPAPRPPKLVLAGPPPPPQPPNLPNLMCLANSARACSAGALGNLIHRICANFSRERCSWGSEETRRSPRLQTRAPPMSPVASIEGSFGLKARA